MVGTNIFRYLEAMAECHPYQMAVIFPEGRSRRNEVTYTHLTYRKLHENANRLAQGLKSHGLRRTDRVLVMLRPSLEYFETVWALFKIGAVPVMIDPGMGLKNSTGPKVAWRDTRSDLETPTDKLTDWLPSPASDFSLSTSRLAEVE